MDENFKAAVDKAVEAEKMTQDEADSLTEWYDEKPDGVWAGFGGRGKFGYGRGHGKFRGKGGFHGKVGRRLAHVQGQQEHGRHSRRRRFIGVKLAKCGHCEWVSNGPTHLPSDTL